MTIARRLLVTTAGLALAGTCGAASATAVAYGALSNFDVYNTTGADTYGFEIDLEDLPASSIFGHYTNQYQVSIVDSVADPANPGHTMTKVLYTSSDFTKYFTPQYTSAITATGGHACTGAIIGCNHFGVAYAGNPLSTTYHWLVKDPINAGQTVLGPAVTLAAPSWNVVPVANQPPVVQAVVQAPPPEDPRNLFGPPQWVKVFTTENSNPVVLQDLQSGNAAVPQQASETEVEWTLIQEGTGNQELLLEGQAGNAAQQIIRRYEFYTYKGALTAEGEALPINCSGNTCIPDPSELGPLVGAQMAALNLAPIPIPATLPLLGSALLGLAGIARRRMS